VCAVTTVAGEHTTGADAVDEPIVVADVDAAQADTAPDTTGDVVADEPKPNRDAGFRWGRLVACAILPGLALMLAAGAGYLKWQADSARDATAAQAQSVAAATEDTIALLSYRPDTVDKDLPAACDRLTGTFRDSYSALIHDVVIPGAKQRQISVTATVPAAAAESATPDHAVVLVFVDQTTTMGSDAPTSTISSVKVTLDKIGGRWLISDFTPV
jgi:Mce-associated membrane protein